MAGDVLWAAALAISLIVYVRLIINGSPGGARWNTFGCGANDTADKQRQAESGRAEWDIGRWRGSTFETFNPDLRHSFPLPRMQIFD